MKKIFDPTRKKYVAATPEELVRQGFIKFLLSRGFPIEVIKTEVSLDFASARKRADIVVYYRSKPVLIVECKAPDVKIGSDTLTQIWQYFYSLGALYLVLTNGKQTFICRVDQGKCEFLTDFPSWEQVKNTADELNF